MKDYEEGVMIIASPVKRSWWQFWKSKYIYPRYTKVGSCIKVTMFKPRVL